jgi:hypothetical protein
MPFLFFLSGDMPLPVPAHMKQSCRFKGVAMIVYQPVTALSTIRPHCPECQTRMRLIFRRFLSIVIRIVLATLTSRDKCTTGSS